MVEKFVSKIFVCYSHEDKKYLDLLLKHFNKDIVDVWSDQRIEGGEHWFEEIQRALDSANAGILLLTANFFNSKFIKDIELQQLLKNQYEKNTFLIPVLAEYCNVDNYTWINKKEVLPKGFNAIENIKKRDRNKEIVKIVQKIDDLLKPEKTRSPEKTSNTIDSYNYPEMAVNNFPTSNDKFFGREQYFNILDEAWDNEQINVISFVAFGGIGKTSLIDNWLKNMKKMHYKGANKIFMWSFYSQGSEEDRQVTATEFLLEACKFFKLKKIPKTSYEQGKELADIISKQRVLLILDGLEPLQSSLEGIGEIKDNGLQVLLKRLSRQNKGLVVATSRIKLASIDNKYIELEKLEDKEGAALLKSFELNGTDQELEKISRDFEGHALALKLLGSYTNIVLDRDITRINEIESLRNDQSKTSKHATRMLNSYKKYLKDTAELDILKILGFFDKAISFDVINVIKNKPLIKNINSKLIDVSEIEWKYALNRLMQLHLISNSNQVLDAHPLVREYFSKYTADNHEDSYTEGHKRLYEYYKKVPKKECPDTIEEMEPLFQAVFHGSKAKQYIESYLLYITRIQRKSRPDVDVFYLTYTLGEVYLDQKILANFYRIPYIKFYDDLDIVLKDTVLGNVAFNFMCLGKYKHVLNIYQNRESIPYYDDDSLIQEVINKCQTMVYLGIFQDALELIKIHIDKDLKLKDYGREAKLFSQFAYISFLMGDFKTADLYFKSAEKSYISGHLTFGGMNINYLLSHMGYQYAEFLFHQQFTQNALEDRIEYNFKFEKHDDMHHFTLDLGLAYLNLAKIKLLKNDNKKIVMNLFQKAIQHFKKANDIGYFIECLILKADSQRVYGLLNEAQDDLNEAYDLIIYTESKKQLADWYIVAINLTINEEDFIKAQKYFIEAKELYKELDSYVIFIEQLNALESDLIKGDVWTK